MSTAHLLLVDDDPQLTAILGARLRRDGYEVTAASSGHEALDALDEQWPDLVLLDLMMPGMEGTEVAARIKRRADIPIVVLSAITASESKVELIRTYAEDYVTKPFDYPELRARIERVLRRVHDRAPRRELRLGPDLTLILQRGEAIVDGQLVSLSPTETRFLATLAASRGEAVSTEQLLERVWSEADQAEAPYVWVTVRRLRRKIETDPDHPVHLLSERGVGYRLVSAG